MQSSDHKNERYIKMKQKFYCYFLKKHPKIKPKTCHSPRGSPDLFSEQLIGFLCNSGLHDCSHVLGPKPGINTHPKEKQIPLNHVQRQQNLHPYLGHPIQEFSFLTIKIVVYSESSFCLSDPDFSLCTSLLNSRVILHLFSGILTKLSSTPLQLWDSLL